MARMHSTVPPKYRKQKRTGLGIVTLYDLVTRQRRDFTLGKYRSAQSKKRYDQIVQEWFNRGRRLAASGLVASDVTINEALERWFLEIQKKCKRPDGSATGTPADIKVTVDYLAELFGGLPLVQFGAEHLEQLRDRLIADGRVAPQVNKRVNQARQFFYWCVAQDDLIPDSVNVTRTLVKMKRVKPVAAGEFGAAKGKEVIPADPAAVEKALPLMAPVASAVVRLLRLTGARPSEILNMKPSELDRAGDIWKLTPTWHKTIRKAKSKRVIYLGEQAKAILAPWLLGVGPDEHVFTAQRSEQRRLRELAEKRTIPRYPSHMFRNDTKRAGENRKRPPSGRYEPRTLAHAIRRACARAGVNPFSAYSLRHLKAVELRERYGLEYVRATLGHSFGTMSAHYAQAADAALASKAAAEVG